MKTYPHLLRSRQAGISLFEMLMTISILGLMLSLAVPLLGSQSEVMAANQIKRNAQELASECIIAEAAGVLFVQSDNVLEACKRIAKGAVAETGIFKGRFYGVSNLSDNDLVEASKYLQIANGALLYQAIH